MFSSLNQLMQYSSRKKSGAVSRLPAEYRESYRLSTDGNSYIDTGLKANINDEYIITCTRNNDSGNLGVLGDGYSKTDSNIALWLNCTTNLVEFTYGDGGKNDYKVLTTSYNVTQEHTYRMEVATGKSWLDGDYIGQSKYHSSVPNPKRLVFGGAWRNTSPNSYFIGQIGEFIIMRDGVKIRHFVPCVRLSDGKVGFYDLCESDLYENEPTVRSPFYTSKGSKDFTEFVLAKDPDENSDFQLDVNITEAGGSFTFHDYEKFNVKTKISWGDGLVDEYQANANVTCTHTYENPGIYRIMIYDGGVISYLHVKNTDGSENGPINLKRNHCKGGLSYVNVDFYNSYYMRVSNASFTGNPTKIINNQFANCRCNMMTRLPDSVTTVMRQAFYNNTMASFTELPKSLETIGQASFEGCTSLGKMKMHDSVTTIEGSCFQNCTGINFDSLSASLVEIKGAAFRNCTSLAPASMPDSVTTIDENAFQNCTSFNPSNMPANLKTIGNHAFNGCTSLALTSLPDGLTTIGDSAFYSCTALSLTSLPDSITLIKPYAFTYCRNMSFSSLPPNITEINNVTFRACTNLSVDNLPNGLKMIGAYAFENCQNVSISVIPSPVMTLDTMCLRGCNAMTTVRFLGKPDLIKSDSFYLDKNVRDVYVPWNSGEVDNAPWGMTNVTIHYNCDVSDYYIKDGLQAWYDGIRNTRNGHDPNATKWENLVNDKGSGDLELHLENCGVESDHLHLNGTGLAAGNKNVWLWGNYFTLEIVYAKAADTRGIIIYGYDINQSNPLVFTDSSGNVLISESEPNSPNTTCKYFPSEIGVKTYFARKNWTWYLNGEHVTSDLENTSDIFPGIGFSKPILIGDSDPDVLPSCPGNGDIYCIRFYNRRLTEAEFAHNYNIDRMRFKMYLQESSSSSSESSN